MSSEFQELWRFQGPQDLEPRTWYVGPSLFQAAQLCPVLGSHFLLTWWVTLRSSRTTGLPPDDFRGEGTSWKFHIKSPGEGFRLAQLGSSLANPGEQQNGGASFRCLLQAIGSPHPRASQWKGGARAVSSRGKRTMGRTEVIVFASP